ncbi:MAG TPA: NAD(P)-dependent oxidoreductase, partial [Steroidobacteraceae bacterium]|nr:NAD(P)-dependent oxidoreductase [Steroidobacteraceae bacterium]
MDYLPVFLRVESQPVLVVGGGAVALRKAESLLQAGARVTVVAPRLCASLAARVARGALTHLASDFRPEHLAGAV